jgi:RecA-family ATPase
MARVTSLYGGGGEGKTLLAQMLATACALPNAKWLGLPVRHCKSVLQFCEDDTDEMWRRQEDINRFYGCTFADLSAMRWLPRLGFDNTLMTFEKACARLTPLHAELLRVIQDHGSQLNITDTLADIFGGNENDRTQARAFVQTALGSIARQTGGAVMALAHPSLSGINTGTGSSGSTGWIGTFRSHLFLVSPKAEEGEPADPDARVLTRGKANHSRRGETIELRWCNGAFTVTGSSGGLGASIEKRNCEDIFLSLLGRLRSDGRYVSANSRAGNYAPRTFAGCPDRQGFKVADFKSAMERLFAAKAIQIGHYIDSHRRKIDCLEATNAT